MSEEHLKMFETISKSYGPKDPIVRKALIEYRKKIEEAKLKENNKKKKLVLDFTI